MVQERMQVATKAHYTYEDACGLSIGSERGDLQWRNGCSIAFLAPITSK